MSGIGFELQEIYDTFQPRILRYLTRLVGQFEAEDLTQEVFIKVGQALGSFRGESQLSTWIYRIATNAALDRLRGRSFQQTAHRGDLIVITEGSEERRDLRMEDTTPAVDQELIRKEMNQCIRNFIEALPGDYRTVIVLSEVEGLKDQEVAEILGVTLSTVKIRLHRARERLKGELATHCSFHRDERGELACDLKSAFEEFRRSGEP